MKLFIDKNQQKFDSENSISDFANGIYIGILLRATV